MEMEAETGMMPLPAQDAKGCHGLQTLGERHRALLPRSLQKEPAPPTF